jgi:predicted amidohydrolase YtcJ
VAFHCVSRIELLVVMDCLKAAGVHPADRIEHGAIIGHEMIPDLAKLAIPIVTQPGFICDRGEQFRRNVEPRELRDLYRYKSLIDAGIQVVCSSDAPYGPVSPWDCVAAATHRVSEEGRPMTPEEAVSEEVALQGYLLDPTLQRRREVQSGVRADLCLMAGGRPGKVWLAGNLVKD